MKRMLASAGVVAAVVITVSLSIAVAGGQTPSPTETPSPAPSSSPTVSPTPSPVTPVPTTEPGKTPIHIPWIPPPGYTGALRPGIWVQVTGTDSCLNARVAPGLTFNSPEGPQPVAVQNCLPDGFIGRLTDQGWENGSSPPVQADGHWWWHILGQGWMAEDWLAFNHEDAVPFPPRPDLAEAGLIAFVRPDGVWLANADGSEVRRLVATDSATEYVAALRWSPDGESLAYSRTRWDLPPGQQTMTRIVGLDGAMIAEFAGIAEPSWSPDGRYLSGLRVEELGGLGGYMARPVFIDLSSAAETPVAPTAFNLSGPIWSPDGTAVALICQSFAYQEQLPDGTVRDVSADCEGDGLRIVPVSGGAARILLAFDSSSSVTYANPSWSPDGSVIAVFTSGIGAPCRGYALVDVASGLVTDCLPLPADGFSGFSCGGSAESGATDWSPDSHLLAYHWQAPANETGIAVVNVATGDRSMAPIVGAASVAFSPDGQHLVFGAAGHIWIADTGGSGLTLLGEGDLPAWQP